VIRKLMSFVLLLGLALPSFSQVPTTSAPAIAAPTMEPLGASSNKAAGIELPADQTVKFDEGFVTLAAICKGEVKWLVISATKIKYFTLPTNNTIIVSIPPQGGLITVFAVGLVDGKLTEFARTSITVTGGTTPVTPGPNPPGPNPPGPNPPVASAHVTFVVDLNNTNPALGQILNSQKVREAITTRGAYYRLYDAQSTVLKEKGLDKVLIAGGGPPMIIVQSANGAILSNTKMPGTETEVLQYLAKVLGGQ
jgi:hypothetical protein